MTGFQKTLCWLVFLAGLALLALGIRSGYRRYEMVEHWPSVDAVITRSRAVFASQDTKPRYLAEYSFRYSVNNVPYTAAASVVSSDYREAQAMVAQHPAQSIKTLRYNPENPSEIAMDPAYSPAFFKLPLMLAIASLACLFVGGLPLWRVATRRQVEQITCPNCQRSMDRGRRNCPYCKEELVKY